MFSSVNKCVPLNGISINWILNYVNQKVASSGVSYGSERIVYTDHPGIGANQLVSGDNLYGNPGNDSTDMSDRLTGTWKITSGLSYHHTYSYTVTSDSSSYGGSSGSSTCSPEIYQCYAKQFFG